MCETAKGVSFSSCRCRWLDLWLIHAIWLLSSVGSDGSPRSFTPSLGQLPWTQLLWSSSVAQLGGTWAGFQCRRRTTHETIVIDYTLILYKHSSEDVFFTFLISFKSSQVGVISLKKKKQTTFRLKKKFLWKFKHFTNKIAFLNVCVLFPASYIICLFKKFQIGYKRWVQFM